MTLGPGGPALSRLGLGMAALGRPGYITLGHGADLGGASSRESMRARAHEVLDAAWRRGIRYVDCARSYGDSEVFVRSWLETRGHGPEQVTVGSKWGYTYTADWRTDAPVHEAKDHKVATLERQVAESRAILGSHLAVYQIHSATRESGVLEDGAVLDRLAALRASGLRVGVSVSGPAQADTIRRALDVRRDGVDLFFSVQATWNLLETSCTTALSEAHGSGRAVLVKEALANGRLTARGVAGVHPELAAIARERGTTPDVVALAAVLAQPWADVVLLGATTVLQLESNARALEATLAPRERERLQALRLPPDVYWRERAALPWN